MNLDFTDLVLLIGTNPLPNYVTARYFIQCNSHLKRIWMVCSEKSGNQESTKDYAESLRNLLKNDKVEFPELIFIKDVGSKSSIESGLEKIINQTYSNKVHLSFTGGTKAMAAYSYSYLKDKKGVDFSSSYLSARNFKIKFDDGRISDNLRNSIKITFDKLIELHMFKKKEENADKYKDFDDVVKQFKELINFFDNHDSISNFYSKNGGFLRSIFRMDKKDLEKIFKKLPNSEFKIRKAAENEGFLKTELNNLNLKEKENFKRRVKILKDILSYKPNKEFLDIINAFPKEYKLYENGKFNTNINENNYKRVVKFLDGLWFEQYVGKLIKNKLKDKFDEILLNQEPYINDSKNYFELDIVLMKGYQLVGVSCTTGDEKSLCKSKGFEAILRTKQIGGDEAKAILITRANKEAVEKLQSELMLSTGTAKKNILVLGVNDWKEVVLVKKIGEFISSD